MTRVLVTGGAGFIGSHLTARLARDGYDITVLDNMRRGSRAALDRVGIAGVRVVEGDIRDADALRDAAASCERIYHLAAQSNVLGAIEDPGYSVTTNVLGTFNVLQCAVSLGIPRVVFTSSREVYGEPARLPVTEAHPREARNPYGASKVSGEAYAETFAHCYGLDVAVVRLANVYGPGDRDRVIPLWLEAAASGADLRLYGGEQVLDFVWVDTVVDALALAGEHGLPGAVNIGSGTPTRLADLADRIIEVTRSNSRVVRLPARNAEVTRFVADVTRMRSLGIAAPADPLERLPRLAAMYVQEPVAP